MQINSDELTFLTSGIQELENAPNTPALPMFSERAVAFLSALSSEILKDKRTRGFVDVTSYAYWIRKASLHAAMQKHADRDMRLGRGIALHIAPSNVPVNFAVSMTSSLLAGNITVVRVSDKPFEQVNIICDAVNKLFASDYADMKKYLIIIRYPHSERITQELSSVCDIRVIWGGDRTIETIRAAKLPSRAIEMTFADRHSAAVINSDYYMEQDADSVAKGFYTDTYYTDQNACSSPRIVIWMGNSVEKAKERFWAALEKRVKSEYDMKPIQAVDKYTMFCALGMDRKGVKLVSHDNYILRTEVDKLTDDLMDFKQNSGFFMEYTAKDLSEIIPILGKRCQTISVLGIDKKDIVDIVMKNGVRGVDRVVPLGETMGLEFIWDGYKMIEAMTRLIYINEK